jgi:hypothetical protein
VTRILRFLEHLLVEDFVKGTVVPFLKHPVKRTLAGGGVLILLVLALIRGMKAADVKDLFSNFNFLLFVVALLIAEVLNKVLEKRPRARQPRRKTEQGQPRRKVRLSDVASE